MKVAKSMKRGIAPASHRIIRIVVADDHPVVREGLGALIKTQKDMRVVGEAPNGRQAVELFLRLRPDVLLLDLRMPEMSGVEAAQTILRKAPKAKVIVLSTYQGDEDVYQAIKAGAKAYLLKDSSTDDLVNCIRSVHAGQVMISPLASVHLAAGVARQRLTRREAEIIQLMVDGKSNKEIGASLGVTEGTVKIHTGHIFRKLGAAGRTEAIRLALERGLVHLSFS